LTVSGTPLNVTDGRTAPPKRLLLGAVVMYNGSHGFHGLWRHPNAARQRQFEGLEQWVELGRLLERGRFDLLFFADVIGAYDVYRGGWETTAREGAQFPTNDPLVLLSALVPATEHLGLALTSSVFYQHPFAFARQISTLDHLSRGRVAWNIVTSVIENGAQNVGLEALPVHDDRYVWADEYTDVVYKLWEQSWDADALVRDPDSGIFADPAGIREIRHIGEHFRVRGPHQVPPSPQRTPVLLQAGGSEAGRSFAARNAEAVFVVASTPQAGGKIVRDVRRRAVAAGRSPNDVKFLVALTIVVGATEQEARRRDAELERWISVEGMLAMLSGHLQTDLAAVDLDRPLADFHTEGMQGILRDLRESVPLDQRAELTFRDVLGRFWRSRIVGSPEQVADELERWAAAGIDGVNIVEVIRPDTFEEFVEHVVPVLQDRGLVQREYAPGTLREKLFGHGPHLPDRHRATQIRVTSEPAPAAVGAGAIGGGGA
jgi:FMN-dependent oxidoreductase (nitrilotriacetate monooxygenase family)